MGEKEEGVLWAGLGWGCPALISKGARGEGEQKAPEIKTNCPKTRSLFREEEREKGVLEWKGLVAFLVVLVTNAFVRFVAVEVYNLSEKNVSCGLSFFSGRHTKKEGRKGEYGPLSLSCCIRKREGGKNPPVSSPFFRALWHNGHLEARTRESGGSVFVIRKVCRRRRRRARRSEVWSRAKTNFFPASLECL